MKRMLVSLLALDIFSLGLVCASYAEAPAVRGGLLPTQALARQVRALRVELDSDEDVSTRVLKGKAVRNHLSEFVVRQLESMPSISGDELRRQLRSILCIPRDAYRCEDGYPEGQVFADAWGAKTERRQVIVAYELELGFYGDRSSLVTVESYVWQRQSQRARRTSRGGSEYDGRDVKFEQLTWYPMNNQYWIFVSGPQRGWSGRAYAGKATLYSVEIDNVHALWTSGIKPNLQVQKNELGWEVSYANYSRFYENLPKPSVFDVYKFDYDSRKFERVIHYSY